MRTRRWEPLPLDAAGSRDGGEGWEDSGILETPAGKMWVTVSLVPLPRLVTRGVSLVRDDTDSRARALIRRLRDPRSLVVVLLWLVTAPLLLFAAARIVAWDAALILVWVNSFTSVLYLPSYPVLVTALCLRRWVLAATCAVVVVCHICWALPDRRPAATVTRDAHDSVAVRLFSANLSAGNSTRDGIAAEIIDSDADVLVLQEFSPAWERTLDERGVPESYPHAKLVTRPDAFGIALYSRHPLEDVEILKPEGLPMIRAVVRLPERRLRVYGVHIMPPLTSHHVRQGRVQLDSLIRAVRADSTPVAVVGDFNLTRHHRLYRDLLRETGLNSCHRLSGRGSATTFPNGKMWVPAIRVDHAFVSEDVSCTSTAEGEGQGSDHRPLIVDLALP